MVIACLLAAAFLTAQTVSDNAPTAANKAWPDFSGYISSVMTKLDGDRTSTLYERQNAALFTNKSLGRWDFHSELEFEYASDADPVSGRLGAGAGTLSLETAWLNYRLRDWLQFRGGTFISPTFWAVHHYPNVRLTVQNPLIHERIFPANVNGAMVRGQQYFESGGFEYSGFYGKATGFEPSNVVENGNSAFGGTFLVHLPTSRLLDTWDAGVQIYRDTPSAGMRHQIYGYETRIEKSSFEFLGEFAHSDIGFSHGPRELFRQGFYLEPAWRIRTGWHLYYRYDLLKFDSRDAANPFNDEHTAGINYQPVPWVSLKLEANSSRPSGTEQPRREGFGAGLAFFLHKGAN